MTVPLVPARPAVREALAWARTVLASSGVPEPGLEVQLLLAHVLQRDRGWLLARPSEPLDTLAARLFEALVARRARREPYAYLVGTRHWLDITLTVDRNVLIPRPETELLVECAIRALRDLPPGRRGPVVVDVGTGSGAIAIAIARACPGAQVLATDSSPGALRTAARNVADLARGRVRLLQGDLLGPVGSPAEMVVANLPYIPTADLAHLEPELSFEPRAALDGGPDGLQAIRALVEQALPALPPGGHLVLECGHDQAAAIGALALRIRPGISAHVRVDLAGLERIVDITVPS